MTDQHGELLCPGSARRHLCRLCRPQARAERYVQACLPPHPRPLTPRPAGLWLGLTLALTLTGLSSTYIVWFMDWEKEAEQTRIRLGEAKRDEEQ